MSKVLTVGTFDLPHGGHVELFRKCRKIADLQSSIDFRHYEGAVTKAGEVVVGVNTDQFVFEFKGKHPVYSYADRIAIISGMRDVDLVIGNDDRSLQKMLLNVNPDFLVVGSDWAKKDYYAQIGVSETWLRQYDITLLYVPYTQGISSTDLRGRLSDK